MMFVCIIALIIVLFIILIKVCDYLRRDELKEKRDKTIKIINESLLDVLYKDERYKKINNISEDAMIVEYSRGNEEIDKLINCKEAHEIPSMNSFSIEKAFELINEYPKVYNEFINEIKKLKREKGILDDGKLVEYLNKNPSVLTLRLINMFARNKKNLDNSIYNNIKLYIWKDDEKLYLIPKDIKKVEKIQISIDDIVSFTRDGDVFNEVQISGGGGGGSSITGAVVGGILAGGTGAVIGSRKKIDEIKLHNTINDKRTTILEYKQKNDIKYMFFSSDAYEVFIKMIPNKHFNFVKGEQNTQNSNSNNDVLNKIKILAELKEQNILTEQEFQNKKKDLLDRI